MARGKKGTGKKKDKFDSLPADFKDAIAQSAPDDIKKRISEIALLDCAEKAALAADDAINDPGTGAKVVLKNLMEPYRENFKSYRLQIDYCRQVLGDKGAL